MVWAHVMAALDKNCWPDFPQWECYAANIAGLVSTALWFVVLFPQVLKNWYRRSVKGLSFLWAVANFTASLVNLFFAFSVSLPLYVRVMAVYMPCLEFTILCQFMLYSQKPLPTKLLTLLICLLLWGAIIELELNLPQSRDKIQWIAIALWSIETFPQLNLPQSRDKIQWIAIALWSIETFPQIILNIRLQSTSGQSTVSVVITIIGKTTDFFVTYGLRMPLEYVVMCFFSSSTAFINGFQVLWFGNEKWFGVASKSPRRSNDHRSINVDDHKSQQESDNATTHLLSDAISSSIHNDLLVNSGAQLTARDKSSSSTRSKGTFCYWCVIAVRCLSMFYIVLGLITFAMGLFWRTRSFIALLGPLVCLCVVIAASEYYHAKRSKILEQCGTKLFTEQQQNN